MIIGDLRDRHRRRCIKTVGKGRLSKRRSCETCAQKKLRCSMTRPSCSRCLQLRIQCQYPQSAVSVLQVTDQGQASSDQSLISSTSSAGLAATIEPSLLQSIPYTETAQLNGDNDVAAWDTLASATVDPMAGADTFTDTFQNPDFRFYLVEPRILPVVTIIWPGREDSRLDRQLLLVHWNIALSC